MADIVSKLESGIKTKVPVTFLGNRYFHLFKIF